MKIIGLIILTILLASPSFAQEARKIEDWGTLTCEEYLLNMDLARVETNSNPNSIIYFLVYEGKESRFNSETNKLELIFPNRGLAKAKIRSMKKYLKINKLPIEKFIFIEAGYRENADIEIWSVPNGATPPKPTPTLKKMKYRKGKPRGFCTDCC